jgi:hypothetical protein
MVTKCRNAGCKMEVPKVLADEGFCVLHYTLAVEQVCSEMRRETAPGTTPRERQVEIIEYLRSNGELLARVATAGLGLPDELKARILSTFLTLINMRENLDRAVARAGSRISVR